MADPQAEPYFIALSWLRERLQKGELPPGARITAVDLADDLKLSTTPVREALSRLAGEGLVEDRRGQGFFVRLLSAADIADAYRVSLAHLLIALEPRRARRGAQGAGEVQAAPEPFEAVSAVETMFRRSMAASGSRLLIAAFRVVQIQLGPVRRLEAAVLGELEPEARMLITAMGASRAEHLAQLRQFHTVRIRAADQLAARLEAVAGPRKK